MRLWTIHPKYLDPQGLVALWRESLLARAVLRDETLGYKQHPQLERFKLHPTPRLAINAYLAAIHAEATLRGYVFDRSKLGPLRKVAPIITTSGQMDHEWRHLLAKLSSRSPATFLKWQGMGPTACHPLFRVEPGPVATWERF